MRLSPALLLLASVLPAQVYAPPTANGAFMNARNNYPFQRTGTRVQNFVDISELSNQAAFLMNDIAFRWDEGTTSTTSILTYATFDLNVGTSTRAYNTFTGDFAGNLVGATVAGSFSATAYSYQLAGNPPSTVWGGADGKLKFMLQAPAFINVPPGGSFFFDIKATARTGSAGNALLDFQQDTPSIVTGTHASLGTGCSSGSATATLTTAGQAFPGSTITLYGGGRIPNSPNVRVISAGPLGAPFPLPGSPLCNLYVDLTSYVLLFGTTSATGSWSAYADGTFLDIPASIPNNSTLYFQDIGVNTNNLTLYSSNARVVNLGQRLQPTLAKGWFAGHHLSASSEGAAFMAWGVYAMCMN